MVILDTHGGHHGSGTLPNVMDPGAVSAGRIEASVAQQINQLVISSTGCKDTTDRLANSVNQNLANIVTNMNKYPGDWHLSQHLNAFNGTANGVEVWYWAGDATSKAMAEKASAAIAQVTGMYNRGAKATTSLYVLRNSIGRTLLFEWGFIDNASDMTKLMAPGVMGKAVQAVVNQFGYNVGTPVNPPSNTVSTNPNPCTNGKVGDTVKVYDSLYANSEGAGRSTAKRGSTGVIKRIYGNNKKYLVENWGWGGPNDIQLVSSTSNSGSTLPSNPTPVTNGKVGDVVKVYDSLYVNSEGAGRSTAKRGSNGTIKRVYGNNKKYLVEAWGWAGPNDIQLVSAKKYPGDNLPNSGSYVCPYAMNIRSGTSTNHSIVGLYAKGERFNYDSKYFANGYWWLSYISYSGLRRYVAVI